MELYERLKWLRENANLKQKDMAEILKTTQQYYSEYETGKRKLPYEHIKTVCLYFRVSANYLLDLPTNLQDPRKR